MNFLRKSLALYDFAAGRIGVRQDDALGNGVAGGEHRLRLPRIDLQATEVDERRASRRENKDAVTV